MPVILDFESNRPCQNDTADRVVQLYLAGRRRIFFQQVFLGPKDPDAATIAQVIEDKQKEVGPELAVAGLAVVQFCHRRSHRTAPGNVQLKGDNIELRVAAIMQYALRKVERELMEGSEELDQTGIGTAEYVEISGQQNTFDIGCAQPELHPATHGVEAAHPRGGRRAIGLVHPGITQTLSPAQVEFGLLMGTDI